MALIVLKKQITEEHEIELPAYFKDKNKSFTSVLSETNKIVVCLLKGYTSVSKVEGIEIKFAELLDPAQSTKIHVSEFEDAYHEAMGLLAESLPAILQTA